MKNLPVFTFKGVYGGYKVEVNGKAIGDGLLIHKTFRHGYTYWKIEGRKQTYGTRMEAAQELSELSTLAKLFKVPFPVQSE